MTNETPKKTRKENMMQFRSRLLDLLIKKQAVEGRLLSVQEISDKTGLAKQTIYNWKAGQQFDNLDSETAFAFSKYFGVEINELVEFVPKNDKPKKGKPKKDGSEK